MIERLVMIKSGPILNIHFLSELLKIRVDIKISKSDLNVTAKSGQPDLEWVVAQTKALMSAQPILMHEKNRQKRLRNLSQRESFWNFAFCQAPTSKQSIKLVFSEFPSSSQTFLPRLLATFRLILTARAIKARRNFSKL